MSPHPASSLLKSLKWPSAATAEGAENGFTERRGQLPLRKRRISSSLVQFDRFNRPHRQPSALDGRQQQQGAYGLLTAELKAHRKTFSAPLSPLLVAEQVEPVLPTPQPKSLPTRLAGSVRAHLSHHHRRSKGSLPGRDAVKVANDGKVVIVVGSGVQQSAEVPTFGGAWQEAYQCLPSGSDVAENISSMDSLRQHRRFHSLVTPRLGLGNAIEHREQQTQRRKCSFTVLRPAHQHLSPSFGRSSAEEQRETPKRQPVHVADESVSTRPQTAETRGLVPAVPLPPTGTGPKRKASTAPPPSGYTFDIDLLTQKLEQVVLQREIRMSVVAEEKRLQRTRRKALPIRASVALEGELGCMAGQGRDTELNVGHDKATTLDLTALQSAIKVAKQHLEATDAIHAASTPKPLESAADPMVAREKEAEPNQNPNEPDWPPSSHAARPFVEHVSMQRDTVKTLVDKEQQTSVVSMSPPPLVKVDIGTDVPSLLAYAPIVAKELGADTEFFPSSSSSRHSSCDNLQVLRIYRNPALFPTNGDPPHPQQQGPHHPARRVHSDPVPLNQIFVQPSSLQAAASHGALLDTLRPVACYDAFGLPTTSISASASPGGILAPVNDLRPRGSPLWECDAVGLGLTFVDDDIEDGELEGQHFPNRARGEETSEVQHGECSHSITVMCSSGASVGHPHGKTTDSNAPPVGNRSGCSPSRRSSAISGREESNDPEILTSAEAEVSLTSFLSLCNGSEMDWGSLGVPTELCCEQGAGEEEGRNTTGMIHAAPTERHLPGHYPSTSTLQARYCQGPKPATNSDGDGDDDGDEDSDSDVSFASIRLWRQVVALESPRTGGGAVVTLDSSSAAAAAAAAAAGDAVVENTSEHRRVAKWKTHAQSKQLAITAAFSDDFHGAMEPVMASRFSDDSASSTNAVEEGSEGQGHRPLSEHSRLRCSLETVRQSTGECRNIDSAQAPVLPVQDAHPTPTTGASLHTTSSATPRRPCSISLSPAPAPAAPSAPQTPIVNFTSAPVPTAAVVNVTPPTPPADKEAAAPTKSACSTSSTCGTRVGKKRLSSADAQRVFDKYFPSEREQARGTTTSTATRASVPPLDLLLADRLGSAGDALIALRGEILKRHCEGREV